MPYNIDKDPFSSATSSISSQSKSLEIITPSSTEFATYAKAVVVYTADGGNVSITFTPMRGNEITLPSIPNGWISPCAIRGVSACGGIVCRLD